MKKWNIGGDVLIIVRNNNLSMKMSFRRSEIDKYKNYVGGRKLNWSKGEINTNQTPVLMVHFDVDVYKVTLSAVYIGCNLIQSNQLC